jgi:putative sigma-54 modulation protein
LTKEGHLKIEVTGRHENHAQEVRDYANEKSKKLFKYYKNITKIQVILDAEKDQHSAAMVISVSRGTQLVGEMVHEDIHAAIDLLIDKMERQLVRFKERLNKGRRGKKKTSLPSDQPPPEEEISYDDIIKRDYRGS